MRRDHFGGRMNGVVYTETVVHMAPESFAAEAPYQIAIVTLEDGKRVTGRVQGERVAIDDPVRLVEERLGVPYFKKQS
jgi:uncharacterized OB-fold protein